MTRGTDLEGDGPESSRSVVLAKEPGAVFGDLAPAVEVCTRGELAVVQGDDFGQVLE